MDKIVDPRKKLCNGLESINRLLGKVKEIIGEDISPFYNTPRYIFRGITKYYPAENKTTKSVYTEQDVENGYIKSSLAVRMEKTAHEFSLEKAYIRTNYISYLNEMVLSARKHYPERYTQDYTELDVLADIQHNGGATCLVDFSKNFMTSLWFACSKDTDDDGFIYCYDVMRDMIENDALTYIRPDEEKLSIYDLLYNTHKETNISSNVDVRFYLWEPSPKNNRILRQDSIFVFGIEKFLVRSHGIKVIRVPAREKQDIMYAMKSLYNISSSTIYNDPKGYAESNDKKTPCQKMDDTAYNRGYINMIRGNYACALNFLKLWEGDCEDKMGIGQRIELHFSLAVCYKNLSKTEDNEIVYAENAKAEYD